MATLIKTNEGPVHSSAILTPKLEVTDGLVSYWGMLKGQGSTLFDRVGNNDGTINGATWNNGALDFDGTDDYVDITHNLTMDSSTTVSLWAYPESGKGLAPSFILSEIAPWNSFIGIEDGDTNIPQFGLNDNNGNHSRSTSLEKSILNKWSHFVYVIDSSGSVHFYYQGNKKITDTDNFSGPFDLNIIGGRYTGSMGEYFNGKMDEVRIYDKALSSTEIQTIYNRGRETHNQRTLIPVNTNGLVGYWPMTQGSGGTVYDESKNGNTGTIHGASWTDTANGKVLDFDGTDDYVEVSNDSSLNITDQISVCFWIKFYNLPLSNDIGQISKGANSWEKAYQIYTDTGTSNLKCVLAYEDGSYTNPQRTALNNDIWYFFTTTYDGSTHKLYFDGNQESSQSKTDTIKSNTERLAIAKGRGDYFNGKIDEVRIYDRALSAQEITNIYEKTRGLYNV